MIEYLYNSKFNFTCMNKFNLFLIMSIGAVFAAASIFGSTMTTAFAQGNDTGEVQVGSPLVFTAENATLAGNNATNATTAAAGDSVVSQTPQVDAPQGQTTADGGDQTSDGETSDGETSDGETSDGETSDGGDEGSDGGDEGSDGGDEGSDGGDEGSDGGDEGSDGGDENNN